MTSSLTCDTITDAAGLEAIAPEWWRLWAECARATPFQTPAWLLAWWTTFAPGDLCAVAIRRDGRLAGLAPFYLAHDHEGRRILPLGLSVTDYHDVLLAPGQEESAATALISHMSSAPWDAWELTELQPEAEALRLAPPSGCEVRSEVASACPVLALPSRVEDLPRHFPRRKRRALRTAHNRAARRGVVEISSAESASLDGFDILVRLHRARWEDLGEHGVLADPRVQQFHRKAIPGLMAAGLLRIHWLLIGGCPAAAYYGFHHRDRAYGYLTGFDPVRAFECPGVILLEHAISEAVREGAHEFHFLRGREPYKYGWGARDRVNRRRVFVRVNADASAAIA